MKKWEYKIKYGESHEALTSCLNAAGMEGWELVSVSFDGMLHVLFFKRELAGDVAIAPGGKAHV